MSLQQAWMPTLMTCRACGNWGQKDSGTVKIDAGALHARGKENPPHSNIVNHAQEKADAARKEEQEKVDQSQKESSIEGVRKTQTEIRGDLVEKARQQQEWEAQQAELLRQEEERKAMLLRVKEEQERREAERQLQEAERRRVLMEEMQRREEQVALQQKQEQERQLEEEAKENARKMQEQADQKKISDWLQANGFKEINQLVRKRLSKVTPLQCAIDQKNIEMMLLLLQHGADASKVNGKNESAVTFAQKINKKGSHAAVVQALTAYLK